MQDIPAKGATPAPIPPDKLASEYRGHLARQVDLCDRLEALADSLPASINVQECLYLAQSMVPTVMTAHRFEENEVFPLLRKAAAGAEMAATIERLNSEHMGDEDYANQIVQTLRDFVKDRQSCNPETIAWMLRGFFESMRRHLAFEHEHVLPLLQASH